MPSQAADSNGASLLVLSRNRSWTDAVRVAADQLGVVQVHAVGSASEVVRYLAANEHDFSHLLLQAGSAGGLLGDLVGLTAGEADSGVALVLLGDLPVDQDPEGCLSAATQKQVTFVPETSHGWLERALSPANGISADGFQLSERELRSALSDARIQARYQPIVRMSDRVPVGVEVLARLDHPMRGTLAPHLFVPQIEAAGLGGALAEAVMRRALEDWGGGRLQELGLTLSMNVPLDVLLQPAVLALLHDMAGSAGMPAEHVIIELTETTPLSHLPELAEATRRLRAWGYGLAIDDVGPNVRDHKALLDMPFNIIKLDKELVHEAPDSPRAHEFLLRTIEAAHAGEMTIVAEGVEDAEIWARMATLGVDQAQGFLVARPLPAAAVAIWHRDWCARLHNAA